MSTLSYLNIETNPHDESEEQNIKIAVYAAMPREVLDPGELQLLPANKRRRAIPLIECRASDGSPIILEGDGERMQVTTIEIVGDRVECKESNVAAKRPRHFIGRDNSCFAFFAK